MSGMTCWRSPSLRTHEPGSGSRDQGARRGAPFVGVGVPPVLVLDPLPGIVGQGEPEAGLARDDALQGREQAPQVPLVAGQLVAQETESGEPARDRRLV